jgi:uncharacterized phage-like protein YoqJ
MYNHQIGKVVCGTGHRPDKLGGYSTEAQNIVLSTAYHALDAHKPTLLITGMAQGWDMMLACAALENQIPYLAAVPFKGQELRWSKKDQKLYNHLLKHANKVVYVSESYKGPWIMQKRNEWMVDHSDIILALWDGEPKGGTYNCLKYAIGKKALDKNESDDMVNYWKIFNDLKNKMNRD